MQFLAAFIEEDNSITFYGLPSRLKNQIFNPLLITDNLLFLQALAEIIFIKFSKFRVLFLFIFPKRSKILLMNRSKYA